MSQITEEAPGLQRLSLVGSVLYVHQNPEMRVEMAPVGEAALLSTEAEGQSAESPAEAAVNPETEPPVETGSWAEAEPASEPEPGTEAELASEPEPGTEAELASVPEPGTEAERSAEAAPRAEAEPSGDPEPSAEVAAVQSLPQPIPRAYALEFGTGRVVPLHQTRDGFQLIHRRVWREQ